MKRVSNQIICQFFLSCGQIFKVFGFNFEKIFWKMKFLCTIFYKPEINITNVFLFNETFSGKHIKIFCCRNTINVQTFRNLKPGKSCLRTTQ